MKKVFLKRNEVDFLIISKYALLCSASPFLFYSFIIHYYLCMSQSLSTLVQQVRPSVVRVFVHDEDEGNPVAGTGFFIDEQTILTCAHTLLLTSNIQSLLQSLGEDEFKESALQKFYEKHVRRVEIQHDNGIFEEAIFTRFEGSSDVGLIKVTSKNPFLSVSDTEIVEGSKVFYCGYPKDFQMPKAQWPFSVLNGIVSSKVQAQVGGYAENNLYQLQLPMLGGASGAPLFSEEDGGLIGFMNGYRSWGNDGFMRKEDDAGETVVEDFYVPLPLAVATPIKDALRIVDTLLTKDK
jgi:S1-C subfamily serine protease